MIEADHLRRVIEATLERLPPPMQGPKAVELLMGTAAHESHGGTYLYQIAGPALGIYQMEPATHDSLWANYLRYRPDLAASVRALAASYAVHNGVPYSRQLVTNLEYSTAMARIRYLPAPPPVPGTVEGQAEYWDRWYNRSPDKGFPEQYVRDYYRFCA